MSLSRRPAYKRPPRPKESRRILSDIPTRVGWQSRAWACGGFRSFSGTRVSPRPSAIHTSVIMANTPYYFYRAGFGSNISSWEGPPVRNRKITCLSHRRSRVRACHTQHAFSAFSQSFHEVAPTWDAMASRDNNRPEKPAPLKCRRYCGISSVAPMDRFEP
jgi:hypothetical protein